MSKDTHPTDALRVAVESGDAERIALETQNLMQAVANDLSAVTRKYGSEVNGLLIATVESFAASLRLIADDADLQIAEMISRHTETCTIAPPRKEN